LTVFALWTIVALSKDLASASDADLLGLTRVYAHKHVEDAPAWVVGFGKEFWRQSEGEKL
jgi:hypothetical protein